MSGNTNSSNYHAGSRKKQNKKRQATSPLSENSSPDLNTKEKSNNNSGQKKGHSKKSKSSKNDITLGEINNIQTDTQIHCVGYPFGQYQQTMAFQPGFGPMSQPSYIQTSPSAQYNGSAFGAFQPTTAPPPAPPPWATELLEEVKQIKTKLQSIEKIEKTVNSINVKVSDLETKMKALDTRVNETEKSCQFSSSVAETNKK